MKHGPTGRKDLRTSIGEERQAVREYGERARRAVPKVANLFRHIAGEERHHAREFTKALSKSAQDALAGKKK